MLAFLVFGGGIAGIAAYFDFLRERLGSTVVDILLFIVIAAIGAIGTVLFVTLAIIRDMNAKQKE